MIDLDADTSRLSPALLGHWLEPEDYLLAPHVVLMGTTLRETILAGGGFVMVMMPPRHSKTTTCAKWTPLWFLDWYPRKNVIFASYAGVYSQGWGRRARNAALQHADKLRFAVAQDSAAVGDWHTTAGGGMVAVGMDGVLTGRGADLFVIDDPVKDQVQANSPVWRERCWEWWQQTAFSRREPGATVVLVMCLAGGTPVLMGDGTEKPIRDVRPGDLVATYESGGIRTARVLNWANQGRDSVYEIRMKSGITVRANERHPFLVEHGGSTRWVRLKNLRVGDRILRAIGGSGAESSAWPKDARSRQGAVAFVRPTTTSIFGLAGIDPLPSIVSRGEPQECGIDTASRPKNTNGCVRPKEAGVRSAGKSPERTSGLIGVENCALTMNMAPDAFAGCSATTAILRSATPRTQTRCSGPLSTYVIAPDSIVAITPAGREDVFDIQVETENFIANGLVSHNTRWHEDDLAGRILNSSEAKRWNVLRFPAVAEDADVLGRKPGDALWPERYGLEELALIQANAGAYAWSALYQQRPAPAKGSMFKRDNLGAFRDEGATWVTSRGKRVPKKECWVGQVVDAAMSEDEQADYTAVLTFAAGPRGEILVLEVSRAKLDIPDQWPFILAARNRWRGHQGYRWMGAEDTGSGKALIQVARRTSEPIREIEHGSVDKVTRATLAAVVCENGNLFLPEANPDWLAPFIQELLYFPHAAHDDQVDTLAYAAQEIRRSSMVTAGKEASRLEDEPGLKLPFEIPGEGRRGEFRQPFEIPGGRGLD